MFIEKARAAIAFRRPTKILEENITEGRLHYLKLPGALPVEGGLPIIIDNQYVGAIGVSGVSLSKMHRLLRLELLHCYPI